MQDETGIRIGASDRSPFGDPPPISYGRTDGRTDEEGPSLAEYLNVANKGQENSDYPTRLLDALSTTIDAWSFAGERWPVIRTGQREKIPWGIRTAVKMRDGYRCRICKALFDETDLEIDHVIPWSAGGSSASSNLRTLCKPHNQERQNFVDEAHLGFLRPVTFWCARCWAVGLTQEEHDRRVLARAHGHKPKFCGFEEPAFASMARVHLADASIIAYCAHCRCVGETDVAL